MGKFLKDNWLYILLPILIVLGAVFFLVYFGKGNEGGSFTGYDL